MTWAISINSHIFSIAVQCSIVPMGHTISDIFCWTTQVLFLSISTLHSGKQTPMGSLALFILIRLKIESPDRRSEKEKRVRACFLQVCLSLAVSFNEDHFSYEGGLLYYLPLLNVSHRFLSLGLWRVIAPLLLNLGY